MSYLNGITQKGLEFVTKVTQLLNSLSEKDYEDTYAYLGVELREADTGKVLGYWTDEIGPGAWMYYDHPPVETQKSTEGASETIKGILEAHAPPGRLTSDEIRRLTNLIVRELGV